MAHVKQKGGYKGTSDSESKRLGVKLFGGQKVKTGNIIVRQRGNKYHPGQNVRQGSDDTLYAITDGIVSFQDKRKRTFHGSHKTVKVVSVEKTS